MNAPEVAMPDAPLTFDLAAHSKALAAAGLAIRLVMRVPTPLKSIVDRLNVGGWCAAAGRLSMLSLENLVAIAHRSRA